MRACLPIALSFLASACAETSTVRSQPGGLPFSCLLPGCVRPERFDSPETAALGAFDILVKEFPDWRQYEHAGCIFEIDGELRITVPATLPRPNAHLCYVPPAPEGTKVVADYHNHTSKEEFSKVDLESLPSVPHYLLTPSLRVLLYTPGADQPKRLK